jgi:hypothetical protein
MQHKINHLTGHLTGLEECVRLCWETRHLCQITLFRHCLPTGGAHAAPEHVETMLSCIDLCQAAADAMTRGSPAHADICAACAAVCDAAAESCESLMCGARPCPEMQPCALACRVCAKSCRTLGQKDGLSATIPEGGQADSVIILGSG